MSCSSTRLAKLRACAADIGARAFYVRDLANLRWLTGFDGVFDDEPAHALYVSDARAVLHTDSRYTSAFEAAAAGSDIRIDATRCSHAAFACELLQADCAEVGALPAQSNGDASKNPTPSLAIETSLLLREFRALESEVTQAGGGISLTETNGMVLGLREVKDASEIARMKAAQAITDAAFAHIAAYVRPGMTEREVQIELEDFMLRHGAEGLAFSSIVATGANGASPHAIPGNTVLEAGQCVVLDFGARALGYCSDMTRMLFLGEPSLRMRAAYETLRAANERVEAAIAPGVTGAAMHELAEEVLREGGFGGKMGHGLGHGVGIEVHEEPVLAPRNTRPLVEGNVVTVEPGIYLPGEFGMRLEDFGVVSATGFEVFTCSSHEMVII